MNALHLVFRTRRFNLSKVGAHFINPCCFGEDLAAWLRDGLREKGIGAQEAYQEDWGWVLQAKNKGEPYYLGVSGYADGNTSNPDQGEWRIIVEKKRTVWQRLAGGRKIGLDDPLVVSIKAILLAGTNIRDVHIEQPN